MKSFLTAAAFSRIALAFACLSWMALGSGCSSPRRYNFGSATIQAVESVPVCLAGASLAESAAPAAVAPFDYTTNASDHVVIYQAEVSLTVSGLRETLDRLRALATSLRGHMQEMSENAIVLRVPALRLNEAMQQAEKMGMVTRRTIKGEDVTEEMRDLDIRLRNLDEMRTRLYALLARGTNIQELLLVEKELERVTVDLETLKSRMLAIRTDVAYSTLTVTLNEDVPQAEREEVIPFDWVRGLGQGVMYEPEKDFRPSQLSSTKLRLSCPANYVKVAQQREEVRAMSGEGVTIVVRRHENFENGTLAFWSPLAWRWLSASRGMSIAEEKDVTGATGGRGRLFVATKTVGTRKIQYLVAIYCGEDHVYSYECWGPAEVMTRDREALEKSIGTMEVE